MRYKKFLRLSVPLFIMSITQSDKASFHLHPVIADTFQKPFDLFRRRYPVCFRCKSPRRALQQAQEEIGTLEAMWSVTDKDSDIYALIPRKDCAVPAASHCRPAWRPRPEYCRRYPEAPNYEELMAAIRNVLV